MKTMTDEFMLWWEKTGCLTRSGGGDYERTFAFEAWRTQATRITELEAENERLKNVAQFKEDVATTLRAQLADAKQAARWEADAASQAIADLEPYRKDAERHRWQPIETAPKDYVTEFDGWNGERVTNVSWAHPEYSPKGHFAWCISEYVHHHGHANVEVHRLTHWMPLPAAPAIQAEGKQA